MAVVCNVCQCGYERGDLIENYRGFLECPDCGTELERNSAHGGAVSRDRFKKR